MKLIQMEHKHFKALHHITTTCEPWWGWDRNTSDRLFAQREGFVLVAADDTVVGHITFSNYQPLLEVAIHVSVLPEYQRRWLTKDIYRQVFDHVFTELKCHRAVGVAFEGFTDLNFHERLGFKKEGILRDGFLIRGEYSNIRWFSMLQDERRW